MIYETTTNGSDVVPEPDNATSERRFMTGRTPFVMSTQFQVRLLEYTTSTPAPKVTEKKSYGDIVQ